jgi:3-deoxy-D-manno-octulosonic-acid transferase
VLAELELWPNLIRMADQHGVPVAIVNGRLGDASYRGYRRIRWLIAPVFRRLSWIGAQTDSYARRFVELGAQHRRVSITGSMKFDGAETNRDNVRTRQLADLAGITPRHLVFLAGSTQDPEERLALAAFQQLAPQYPQLRLILVPRHPERFDEVAQLLQRAKVPWQRRSELVSVAESDCVAGNEQRDAPESLVPSGRHYVPPQSPVVGRSFPAGNEPADSSVSGAQVLLVDTIGELGAWWGLAQVAFVGGSLGSRGGQNMIEPAAYGAAVCFGPNTWNFRDAVQRLRQADAAAVVQDGPALARFVQRCLDQENYRRRLGQNARQLVLDNQGAAARTCDRLLQLLSSVATNESVSRLPASSSAAAAQPRKSA